MSDFKVFTVDEIAQQLGGNPRWLAAKVHELGIEYTGAYNGRMRFTGEQLAGLLSALKRGGSRRPPVALADPPQTIHGGPAKRPPAKGRRRSSQPASA